MYDKFFGLAEAPFNITPDSKFLFLSQRHREALSALLYGIKERKGFILLTGEIGSGKTTICRALVHELRSENIRLALILNPGLSEIELLKTINDEFQIPSFYDTKKGLIDALNRFLIAESEKGNNVALIIDEAQNLEPSLLEQIRLLSNLETENSKLIQIVLIGQPELNETLSLTQLEQLNQRISVRFHIAPLSDQEMLAYIKHRLFVARAKIDIEFTPGALKLAFHATRGIPRKINVLCDRALLACYVDSTYTVDDKIMQQAISEVLGDEPMAAPVKRQPLAVTRKAASAARVLLSRRAAIAAGATAAIMTLVAVAVAVGIRIANIKATDTEGPRPATLAYQGKGVPSNPGTMIARDAGKSKIQITNSDETTSKGATVTEIAAKPAPTPSPEMLEQRRRANPNWKYEKTAPLVRVNNPKTVLRAAQLSMLKMWGIVVNLGEMTKLGDDLILHGELKSDAVPIHQVSLKGSFYDAVRFNVPMIVKLKTSNESESEYVVLLRAEGDAVTVGDPVWGVKNYTAKDINNRWLGGTAVFVDVNHLGSLHGGDKNEYVRALQRYLKDHKYLAEVSGVFDKPTTQAIEKFQSYYKTDKVNGQLDDLTVMLLNSRMMEKGPKLNNAADAD